MVSTKASKRQRIKTLCTVKSTTKLAQCCKYCSRKELQSREQQFRLQPLVVFTETQSPKPLFYAMLGVVVGVYRISCHVPHTVSYWSLSNLTEDFVSDRKYSFDLACFMADFRDAEILTWEAKKVPQLRSDARFMGLRISGTRKADLVASLVAKNCTLNATLLKLVHVPLWGAFVPS